MKRRIALWLCLTLALSLWVSAAEPHRKNTETSQKIVALTFDDGPHEAYTQTILSILEKYRIPATFFIIGENAQRYPDRVRQIHQAGHELGNHTYSHASVNTLSAQKLEEELEKTSQLIQELTGQRPAVFRPPFGAYNDRCIEQICQLGYRPVLWSQDSRDWQLPPAQRIADSMLANLSQGDILLFHDYNRRHSPTPQALEILIPKLLEEGYRFVTVSQLFAQTS